MSTSAAHELKKIRTESKRIDDELAGLRATENACKRSIDGLLNQRRELDARRKVLMTKPHVTEHALLRYLERVQGVDLAAVEAEILNEKNLKTIETLGDAKIPLGDGHVAVVRGKGVVTVE